MKNNTIILLDNSMFDDGSFECRTYWLNNEEGTMVVNPEFIERLGVKDLVLKRQAQGERWLNCRDLGPLVYGGLQVLEIVWDC